MQVLFTIDNKDYIKEWEKIERSAARAVIVKNHRIALVKCGKVGYYKFPGGGVKQDEALKDALAREVAEETGLILTEITYELGAVKEIRKDIKENKIFEHTSFYYFADVSDAVTEQNLDNYEDELDYFLEWTRLSQAYKENLRIFKEKGTAFLKREIYIMKYLMDNFNF